MPKTLVRSQDVCRRVARFAIALTVALSARLRRASRKGSARFALSARLRRASRKGSARFALSARLRRASRKGSARFALSALLLALLLVGRRADAEPAKQGAGTATVLATESGRPTPGVDAPKAPAAPHKAVHRATAKVKTATKPKATTKPTKPAHVKPVKTHQPKAHVPRPVGAKPSAAPPPASAKPATRV